MVFLFQAFGTGIIKLIPFWRGIKLDANVAGHFEELFLIILHCLGSKYNDHISHVSLAFRRRFWDVFFFCLGEVSTVFWRYITFNSCFQRLSEKQQLWGSS